MRLKFPTSERILAAWPVYPAVHQSIVEVWLTDAVESGYESVEIEVVGFEARLVRTYCAPERHWPTTESPDHQSMVEAGWTWEGDYTQWVPMVMEEGMLIPYDNPHFDDQRAWALKGIYESASSVAEGLYSQLRSMKERDEHDCPR